MSAGASRWCFRLLPLPGRPGPAAGSGTRKRKPGPFRAVPAAERNSQTHRRPGPPTRPAWKADYRAIRPKVERELAHLMRRRHGGRRARARGRLRVAADFTLLAAATNLARLARLGLTHTPHHGWALNPT